MKSAHDVLSCSAFRERISYFIDGELDTGAHARFLEHAAVCQHCNQLLQDIRSIRYRLQSRKMLEVSPEFDFRLKSVIRREARLLQSPAYRARIAFRENILHVFAIPAAAAVVIGLAFSPIELYMNPGSPVTATTPAETVTDAAQDVNYVLDTVDEETVNQGIFLNDGRTGDVNQPAPTLTSISF